MKHILQLLSLFPGDSEIPILFFILLVYFLAMCTARREYLLANLHLIALTSNQQNYAHESHSYVAGSVLLQRAANLFYTGPDDLCCDAGHVVSVATALIYIAP